MKRLRVELGSSNGFSPSTSHPTINMLKYQSYHTFNRTMKGDFPSPCIPHTYPHIWRGHCWESYISACNPSTPYPTGQDIIKRATPWLDQGEVGQPLKLTGIDCPIRRDLWGSMAQRSDLGPAGFTNIQRKNVALCCWRLREVMDGWPCTLRTKRPL